MIFILFSDYPNIRIEYVLIHVLDVLGCNEHLELVRIRMVNLGDSSLG